ncbi:MAG: hypothetical protein H6831_04665 [Planctomycetes bacterium]|nr:hypothetical protein [Planctomycetota bacterium]MCB9903681.1 hypothetical protein [Planctomycetota bacterium]
MRIATWTLPALLVLPLMAAAPVSGGEASAGAPTSSTLGTDWIVSSGDNVCGVSDARQISNPAKVSYDSLLSDTAELKEMKKKGIDKDSPEGQILHNKGVDRVRKAAKSVMTDKSHCSVWKKITSRSGQSVPDITEAVRAQL